ncbi:MAG: S9 family peptidase [Actinomycetota bacterium]
MSTVEHYGSWASPISPADLASGGRRLGDLRVLGDGLAWIEGRPDEAGRSVLVVAGRDGSLAEPTPADWSVRTLVHEYGGGAVAHTPRGLVVSNLDDQRLYLLAGDTPTALTPEPPTPRSLRYADGSASPDGRWLYCVREVHDGGHEPTNDLVAVALDGSGVVELADGWDFVMAPTVAPGGSRLAWFTWDHPRMPWDGTELWVADVHDGGTIGPPELVAGGPDEAVQQPTWIGSDLAWVTDRTGWWNLVTADGPLTDLDAEVGLPPWVFGRSSVSVLPDGSIAAAAIERGIGRLVVVRDGAVETIDTPFSTFEQVRATPWGTIVVLAAGPRTPLAVAEIDPVSGAVEIVRSSTDEAPDPAYIAEPEAIEFPSADGRRAHAFFYPPAHAEVVGPDDERPPLIVMSHGGPTSATAATWDARVGFWTTRGFAVADVNYGGSTGYGRPYRRLLDGAWGVVDLEDCVAAARWLADQGRVDGERLLIRGGSAGGYTTLCALTFTDAFAAGTSLYGIGDLEVLARDTHKFEARYLDGLVGTWPADTETYRARSPIHHVDRISTPMLVLQGSEDPVVPPNQAESMVAALDERGIPHAYLLFEGESHGFRQADTIVRSFEAEYAFYCAVLGITPPDGTAGVDIAHAESLEP